jgi:hypothetical protein
MTCVRCDERFEAEQCKLCLDYLCPRCCDIKEKVALEIQDEEAGI